MKSLVIFLLLCFLLCNFYCMGGRENGEQSGVTKSKVKEVAKQVISIPSRDSKRKSKKVLRKPKEHEPSTGLSPSVELALTKSEKFEIRRDFLPLSEHKNIERMVYFCPAESYDEHVIETITKFQYCLFMKEKSKTALSLIQCSYDPQPKLWNYPNKENTCGENHTGVRYRFLYQDDDVSDMKNDFVQVYSMCMLKRKETLYLKYHLIVPSPVEYYSNTIVYPLEAETQGFVHLHLKKLKKFYEQTEQEPMLRAIFGAKFTDVLIPQKLISPKHIKPRIARTSLYNYLNIKPQWKSLEKDWLALEDYIWQIGLQHHQDIVIYAGTYSTIRQNNQEIYLKIDNNNKLSIPLIWWKLIIKNHLEGIIIAMHNVPKEYPQLFGEKLCKKSICTWNGWEEIDEIAYCCAFDETKRNLLNLHEEKIKIIKVFDPSSSKSISKIMRWFRRLVNKR